MAEQSYKSLWDEQPEFALHRSADVSATAQRDRKCVFQAPARYGYGGRTQCVLYDEVPPTVRISVEQAEQIRRMLQACVNARRFLLSNAYRVGSDAGGISADALLREAADRCQQAPPATQAQQQARREFAERYVQQRGAPHPGPYPVKKGGLWKSRGSVD